MAREESHTEDIGYDNQHSEAEEGLINSNEGILQRSLVDRIMETGRIYFVLG
jgi:hypothetical protein